MKLCDYFYRMLFLLLLMTLLSCSNKPTPRKTMIGHWKQISYETKSDNPNFSTKDTNANPLEEIYVSKNFIYRIDEPGSHPVKLDYKIIDQNFEDFSLNISVTPPNEKKINSKVIFSSDRNEIQVITRYKAEQIASPDLVSIYREQVGGITVTIVYRHIDNKTSPSFNRIKAEKLKEKESNELTDIDCNVYKLVKIGNQIWMAENLKVAHFRNGDAIQNITDDNEWSLLSTSAYCNYNNDTSLVNTYGRLYNWFAMKDPRNIAPEGWHVPTNEDWNELGNFLEMNRNKTDSVQINSSDIGGTLKEAGTEHWKNPNTGATNESGFTARPGGYRTGGDFKDMGKTAEFWSSSGSNIKIRASSDNKIEFYIDNIDTRSFGLVYDRSKFHAGRGFFQPNLRVGYSIRLVKDKSVINVKVKSQRKLRCK